MYSDGHLYQRILQGGLETQGGLAAPVPGVDVVADGAEQMWGGDVAVGVQELLHGEGALPDAQPLLQPVLVTMWVE